MDLYISSSLCCDCLNQYLGSQLTEDMLYLENGICRLCGRSKRVMTGRQSRQLSQVIRCLAGGALSPDRVPAPRRRRPSLAGELPGD